MSIAPRATLEYVLFAVLGSGSWLVVSALFNQLVLMLPDFEQSQRGFIFSLMNVAVQASKLPALVYASRKLTVSTRLARAGPSIEKKNTHTRTGPQAACVCGAFHRHHYDNFARLLLEFHHQHKRPRLAHASDCPCVHRRGEYFNCI